MTRFFRDIRTLPLAAALIGITLAGAAGAAHMQTLGTAPAKPGTGPFTDPAHFDEATGEQIYVSVCTGCHMPGGRGAIGAGAYPALAKNAKLEVSGYPISMVLHGQKAMPAFGEYFSDQQVAEVVNYVRSHFGNDYKDTVTAQDVKDAR